MAIYTLRREQLVPRPLEEVFEFFSDAAYLQKITPHWLSFQILTPGPIDIRPGTLLDYRLKWHGLGVKWRTEIVTWKPPCVLGGTSPLRNCAVGCAQHTLPRPAMSSSSMDE